MVTISREEFDRDLKEFLFISQQTSEPWEEVEATNYPGFFYGSLSLTKNIIIDNYNVDEKSNCRLIDEDDNQVVCSSANMIVKLNYHIIYSESYSAPVLYFQASHANGSSLGLQEIWKLIPKVYFANLEKKLSDEERFEFLSSVASQTEHPYLGAPFYFLHPCQTSALIFNAFNIDKFHAGAKYNIIITWLSSVGPLVGLNLDSFYAKALEKMKHTNS